PIPGFFRLRELLKERCRFMGVASLEKARFKAFPGLAGPCRAFAVVAEIQTTTAGKLPDGPARRCAEPATLIRNPPASAVTVLPRFLEEIGGIRAVAPGVSILRDFSIGIEVVE